MKQQKYDNVNEQGTNKFVYRSPEIVIERFREADIIRTSGLDVKEGSAEWKWYDDPFQL